MKISKIYLLSKEEFANLVQSNNSISSILKILGLHVSSGNYKIIKRRLLEEQVNYSHITTGRNHNIGRKFTGRAIPFIDLLTVNSICKCANDLKKRLIKSGLLINKCYLCNMSNEWQGKPISLQMDHINGINNDNRIENLRILCPNCHSQTSTYASRNRAKVIAGA